MLTILHLPLAFSGVARGCGWQHIGAYVNLCAFYLIGVPLALVLGFLMHMGGEGLRIGILGGATAQAVLLAAVASCTNWQQQVCSSVSMLFYKIVELQAFYIF